MYTETKTLKKQQFLNTYVNNVTMSEALRQVESLIESGNKSYIVAINTDVVIKIENDPYLKKITDRADMVLVDGQPLVWISRWIHRPIKEKVSGSDLVPKLCKVAAEKGYSMFIIGGAEGVAEKARQNIERKFPMIKIKGTYAPPYGFEKDENELQKIRSIISNAKPDILITCFGCPKQEKFIYENYQKYDAKVSICAGATVDFLAGNVKRAPKWVSDHGLEWLWRFFKEPKRMFKRYFIDDMKIFQLIRKYKKI